MRARDVQILFADAATGARSPALVHQGKIGEIIQAKPEQRRRVLEDAAGVAGLHARRHEAELRLKAAETNLTRVEDVIGQLAGQIDGLKKQARQAIRFREVAAKVRKAEATLFHLRWLEANADVGEAARTHDLNVREMAERRGMRDRRNQSPDGTRWRSGRDIPASGGRTLHYPPPINTTTTQISARYLSEEERVTIADLRRTG